MQLQLPEGERMSDNPGPTVLVCKLFRLVVDMVLISHVNPVKINVLAKWCVL